MTYQLSNVLPSPFDARDYQFAPSATGLLLALNCFAGERRADGSVTLTAEEVATVEHNIEALEAENAEYDRLINEAAAMLIMMQMKIDALEGQMKKKGMCL
jgi:hypothetical protein